MALLSHSQLIFISFAFLFFLKTFKSEYFLFPCRYWPVIDNAIRQAAYDRGVQVRMIMSNWDHTKKEMIPMLQSLQDFGKACKSGNISVVSNSHGVCPYRKFSIKPRGVLLISSTLEGAY